MKGRAILVGVLTLASALFGFACPPATQAAPAVSSPQACAVYAAVLAKGPVGQGLYTMMQDGKTAYDIRCDWAALGAAAPKLIGLPSADCKAAMARHQKEADAVCGLPPWTVTLSRPTFSAGGAHASLVVTRMYRAPQGWYGARGETCELTKAAGGWRVTACRANWMT
jgi:hypothetical protein